jgi:hypothetical protein
MSWINFPSQLPNDFEFDYKNTHYFVQEPMPKPTYGQPALPTPEQLKQWWEQYKRLEDQVREQQFQKARLRALVEDVAKLAGVRIKVLEEGEQ